MPHIILETPQDFDLDIAQKMINITEAYLVKELPTKLETFKSRVYQYVSCSIAGEKSKNFLHLQIKVLSVRAEDHLVKLSASLKEKLLEAIKDKICLDKYLLTLEIVELSSAYAN